MPAERASYRKSAGFGAVSFLVVSCVSVISGITTARLFGIHVIGEWALALAPSMIIAYLSTAREQAALVRELTLLPARAPRVTGLLSAVFAFSLALTVVVAAIGTAAAYLVFEHVLHRPDLFAPALVTTIGYVVLQNSGWNLETVLTAFRAGRELFWVRLLSGVSFVVCAAGASFFTRSVWGLVWANLLSWLLALIVRLIVVRPYMRFRVSRSELRAGFGTLPDLLRFGLRATPGYLATAISFDCGAWILALVGSVSAVGAWSRAWALSNKLTELPKRISEMLFPTMVERRARGDVAGYDRALADSTRYAIAVLMLPAAAGGGAALGVMNLFGPGFSQAAGAVTVSMLVPALFSIVYFERHVLYAANRPTLSTVTGATGMVITIATTVPLSIAFGATGTAVGLVCGLLAEFACMWRPTLATLTQPVRVLWPPREMLAVVAAYAVAFAVAHVIDRTLGGVGGLGLALVAGSLTYIGAFLALGGVNARDRERLRRLGVGVSAARDRRSRRLGVPARSATP
jgi:O-antigen/teichoic acid export membrane protein